MRGTSKEERVAQAIGKTLTDFTLDLEAVGFYLAKAQPYLIFRRAMEVLESAEAQSEGLVYNQRGNYYRDRV
jgi:hypothetical protein